MVHSELRQQLPASNRHEAGVLSHHSASQSNYHSNSANYNAERESKENMSSSENKKESEVNAHDKEDAVRIVPESPDRSSQPLIEDGPFLSEGRANLLGLGERVPFPSYSGATASQEDMDNSVIEVPVTPTSGADASLVCISDDSKEDSLRLELSETQPFGDNSTQAQEGTSGFTQAQQDADLHQTVNNGNHRDSEMKPSQSQNVVSSQLSEILAPNRLLYADDINNMIDNDEDLQSMSTMMDQMGEVQDVEKDSLDVVLGLNSSSRLELADMSPSKVVSSFSGRMMEVSPLCSPLRTKSFHPTESPEKKSSTHSSIVESKKRKAAEALSSSEDQDFKRKVEVKTSKSPDMTNTMEPDLGGEVASQESSETVSISQQSTISLELLEESEPVMHQSRSKSRLSNGDQTTEGQSGVADSLNLHTPDISCSPIVHEADANRKIVSDENFSKERRTSTPGNRKNDGGRLSTPEKMIRKKLAKHTNIQTQIDEHTSDVASSEAARLTTLSEGTAQTFGQQTTSSSTSISPSSLVFKEPSPVTGGTRPLFTQVLVGYKESNRDEQVGEATLNVAKDAVNDIFKPLGIRFCWQSLSSLQSGRSSLHHQGKRLSDVSMLSRSSSGSSGYLASGSSGASSIRSRLSIVPEAAIEPHLVSSPLPSRRKYRKQRETDQEEKEGADEIETVSSKTDDLASDQPEVKDDPEEAEEEKYSTQRKGKSTPRRTKGSGYKSKQRKGRTVSQSSDDDVNLSARKRAAAKSKSRRALSQNLMTESSETESATSKPDGEPSQSATNDLNAARSKRAETETETKSNASLTDRKLERGSKVFARWFDAAGVYYYAAEVMETETSQSGLKSGASGSQVAEHVKVRFLEDNIIRTVRAEGEILPVELLSPGDQVTVMHDELKAYEVTATLMNFPMRGPSGEIEYEVAITPLASEPQINEDSRVVPYNDVSLSDSQASRIIRQLGLVPASNRVSSDIDFENLIYAKRKPRTVIQMGGRPGSPAPSTPSKAGQLSVKKSGGVRRKRGGSNLEDSASTTMAEEDLVDTVHTPRRKKGQRKTATSSAKKNKLSSSKLRVDSPIASDKESNDDIIDTNSVEEASSSGHFFKGMCFVVTQSKYKMPMTDCDDSDTDAEVPQPSGSDSRNFDKSEIRNIITSRGGRILQRFPTHVDLANTLDEELLVVSDKTCLTLNYLLALAHKVPIINYLYILDCDAKGAKLKYKPSFLLPAGYSSLLMQEVEQGHDYTKDLQLNGCLLPQPPATSTRLSHKSQDDDTARKKILTGLHVLVISLDKDFTDEWQSVLDSLGARVTKRISDNSRLAQIRIPDVVVTDKTAPHAICEDLKKKKEIPVVTTNWIIQCVINNARVGYDNFFFHLR